MESLPPPCQRQNMNTMPFVNQPQLSNQAHMCLYVSLSVCVCAHMYMFVCAKPRVLACWQRKWNVTRYVCACTCLWGVMDESRTLPNILCLYICLNV